MTKIALSTKDRKTLPKAYCRIVLTEDKPNSHRLVETKDGLLEYRMGIGKFKELDTRKYRTVVRSIVQAAKAHQLKKIALEIGKNDYPQIKEKGSAWAMQTLAANLTLAAYEFKKYKTTKKIDTELTEILVCGKLNATEKTAFNAGVTIGESANITRDVANTSGEDMTPSKLALATKKALTGSKVTVKVLDHKQIAQKKMGLLTAVGKGAEDREKLIIMEYWGAGKTNKKAKQILLIGKGITYDTGGLNVKPSGAMHDMHMDMSGGAAMIGAMRAIAKLGIKKNVIAIVAAAENSVSARAMRAGDIATSMSGKTVEILHTDAEGRLVLADALTYAQKFYKPTLMIDAATLTGAALVALGQHASAVMTKDKKLQDLLIELGEDTGDLTWPLPLWDEYKKPLMSTRADIANIAVNFSRYGGSIEGGTFLSFFVEKKIPWAHLDIAPRMESVPNDKLAKGAAGEPVQLLVELVKRHK